MISLRSLFWERTLAFRIFFYLGRKKGRAELAENYSFQIGKWGGVVIS